MTVSFIVPLHNGLVLTQAMIASLHATVPSGVTQEIILVDDASTDRTRAWLAGLPAPHRVLLNERNAGFAASCNRGAANAAGDVLVFLNNDLELKPHWLEPMLAAFQRFPRAGLIGNVQRRVATGAIDHTGIFFNHKGKPEHSTARPVGAWVSGYRKVAALTGACVGIQAATWRTLGGFDESFVNGAEDIDLCLRARAQGLDHYVAMRSVVRHHVSASVGRKLRDEENTRRLVERWGEVIAVLMRRAWCRHHLETYWADPRDFPDQSFARDVFYYLVGLRRQPPPGAAAGARAALELERRRWDEMFGRA